MLASGARAFISFGLANPEMYRLMFEGALAAEPPEEEPSPRLQLWELYRDPFRRGLEEGVFRGGDVEVLTTIHWSLLHGFVLLALSGRAPAPGVSGDHTVESLGEALIADRLAALCAGPPCAESAPRTTV
jgi:hypothetical protein